MKESILKEVVTWILMILFTSMVFITAIGIVWVLDDVVYSVEASYAEVLELNESDYIKLNNKYIRYNNDGQTYTCRMHEGNPDGIIFVSEEVPNTAYSSRRQIHMAIVEQLGGN